MRACACAQDEGALSDLMAAKRAHEEALRRARAPLLPPEYTTSGRSSTAGAWWRVVHSPAVVVRDAPSLDARKLGLKLSNERVFALEERTPWVRVHAPSEGILTGWMLTDASRLTDARVAGMGVLMTRCLQALPPSRALDDDDEANWEYLASTGLVTSTPSELDVASSAPHADAAPATCASPKEAPKSATLGARLRSRLERNDATRGVPDVSDEMLTRPPPAPSALRSPRAANAAEAARLKSLGDAAFRGLQYALAVQRYSEALAECDGASAERAVLLCNRSAARRLTRDLAGALEDASGALDISPTYRKAALRYAITLLESEQYARALDAFLHVKRLDCDWPNLVTWLQRCHQRIETARDGEPNYYSVLDVPCDCGTDALKQAYRRQSLRVHPDRAAAGAADSAEAASPSAPPAASTGAFQQLQRAYEVLRDPQRRREYDFGSSTDWELQCRGRHWPPSRFKPFVRPRRDPPGMGMWDPCE